MTRIDYASAGVVREPWGPIRFRWSARSVVLIAIVLVAGVWLRLRHSPYTVVTVLPVAPFFMGFHDHERLVTADTPAGVRVWDVRTSRLLENPIRGAGEYGHPRASDPRYYWDEKALLALSWGRGVRQVRPGREPLIRTLPRPRLAMTIQDASASGARLVSAKNGHLIDMLSTEDLETGALNGPVRFQSNQATQVTISGDGGTRLFLNNGDVRDFVTLGLVTSFSGSSLRICAHEKYYVTMSVDHPAWRVYLRDYKTGAVWHSVRVFFNTRGYVQMRLSPDARTLAVVSSTDGVRPGQTFFHDLPSETLRAYYERDWSDIHFLPGSEEFFCFDPRSNAHALFRVGSAEPLAILPDVESSGECPPVVSRDGRWLACGGPHVARGTTVLKRTGWDCSVSPKGVLAFPQTWLLASSLTGAAWSLRRDAKRVAVKRRGDRRWRRLVGGCVFSVLVVLSAQALLVIGLGRRPPMTAAPLLLIGWIGLGTGSRFWRVTAMVMSAGVLAWCVTCFMAAWKMGWTGTVALELLDRVYIEPRATGLVALAIATVASGIAVAWMATTLGASESTSGTTRRPR